MKLYLIRHGETVHNTEGIVQGWSDSELTEYGRTQAAKAGEELAKLNPSIVFASDLGRVQQSLIEMRKSIGDIPVLLDWRLRERRYGEAEGKPKSDFANEALRGLSDDSSIKNLEPLDALTDRVLHFISDLLEFSDEHEHVVIVTHNGVINRFAFLTDESKYEWTEYTNGDILELELQSGD